MHLVRYLSPGCHARRGHDTKAIFITRIRPVRAEPRRSMNALEQFNRDLVLHLIEMYPSFKSGRIPRGNSRSHLVGPLQTSILLLPAFAFFLE